MVAKIFLAPVALAAAQLAGPSAEQLSKEALQLFQAGKNEQAIATLKKAVARDPQFFPAYSLLGVVYSQLGKLEEARGYFEKAVQIAPKSTQARNNLGANYLALGKPRQAAAQFEKVLAVDPVNVTAWVNLGNTHLQLGNFPKAIEALEKGEKLSPGADPRVLATLAVLFHKDGRPSQATEYLGRVRGLGPAGEAQILSLAQANAEQGDYQTVLFVLKDLEASHQDSAVWHELVGYSHFKLDHPEPALKHLQTAVQLDPRNEDYYLTLAEFLGTNNAVDSAVTVLDAAAKGMPGSVKIGSALGLAYIMLGDTTRSEAVLKQVVEHHPDYELGHKLLADCYNRAQDWVSLKQVAAVLRKLNAKNGAGWYFGALAEYHLVDPASRAQSLETIRQYTQKAVDLDPHDWRSQVLLGKLLLETGKKEEAVVAFRKAVSLNGEEPSSYYLLATTLRELGRREESTLALKGYQTAQANEKARKFRTMLVEIRR